jgi:hypothetical protein
MNAVSIVSFVSMIVFYSGVAEAGFVRRTGDSSNGRASAHTDEPMEREVVSVTSDLVRSYHVGQDRDVVREHYLGDFSAPTHMIYDPVKLSKVSVGPVNQSFEQSLSFAELVNALVNKSDEMGAKDEVNSSLDEADSREGNMTEAEARGWVSKACFYVGESASRSKGEDEKDYPDLSDVCNPELIGASDAKRCCVCPHMIKAVRPGKNSMFTSGGSARNKCADMGKSWIHEGGLCQGA